MFVNRWLYLKLKVIFITRVVAYFVYMCLTQMVVVASNVFR